jgi:transposase
MAGTTKPTVYKWIGQYDQQGVDGVRRTGAPR